jgi:hypothetical protein
MAQAYTYSLLSVSAWPGCQDHFTPFEHDGKYHLGHCEVSTNMSKDLLINRTFSVEEVQAESCA